MRTRSRPGRARARLGVAIALLAAGALAGCGDDGEAQPPSGPLASALAQTGGGGANGSLGFGWTDPRLAAERGLPVGAMAAALGPNAGSFVDSAARLRERFGVDPLSSQRLISIGGSYAFGLRLDGVEGQRLARVLQAAGARSNEAGGVELIEIGGYAEVPRPLLDAGVRGLGAFDALGSDFLVAAISEGARSSLLGDGGRLLDEPTYAAAARCLGDVAAARMTPDKLLLSNEQGVDLLATGVRDEGEEVLCVLGGTAERSDAVAAALERSLEPSARDPVSGEPVGRSVASAKVTRSSEDGVEIVEAELELAPGRTPGYLFGTIAQGSLVGLINDSGRAFTRRPDSEALARGHEER